jgi:iron complex outermembrane receptor protein
VPLLPNGDDYYNPNTVHDRQIAGFGEVTYSATDQLKFTLGGRVAKTSFDIYHFTDGPENYGTPPPDPASASQRETPFTPKAGVSFQMDPNNLFYFTYAKGFRVGGANAPLPTYCSGPLMDLGYASGQAPPTYKSDSTQSYEIGSKDNFANMFSGSLPASTTSSGTTFSRMCTSPATAGCSSRITSARRWRRAPIFKPTPT